MEKVTDLPLGRKFLRQSKELAAIDAKLGRRNISPNRASALKGAKIVVSSALNRTVSALQFQMNSV